MKAGIAFVGLSAFSAIYHSKEELESHQFLGPDETAPPIWQTLQNIQTRHERTAESVMQIISFRTAFSLARGGYHALGFGGNEVFEPIWTPPRRMSPEEEYEKVKKRHAEAMATLAEWKKYPLRNEAEKHESNVHPVTLDKRMEEYIYGDDEEDFLPDMGAPMPDYHTTSPYNKKTTRNAWGNP